MSNPIGWATKTVNPVVGCTMGCDYCFARRMAKRQKHNCRQCYDFTPHLHPERLPQLEAGRGQRVFVGDMCDLWDPTVPQAWRDQVYDHCIGDNTYLFLTKRPEWFTTADVDAFRGMKNWWFGVTVTDEEDVFGRLVRVPWTGQNLYVSFEPLLGAISDTAYFGEIPGHVSWAIVGPQTGPGAAPCERGWVEALVERLRGSGIPVWMKSSCAKLWPDMELVQELPDGMHGAGVR